MEEEITFTVATCPETGGFIARWDDPRDGGITTQGDTLGELQAMITDAVSGYFDPSEAPARIKIHFEEDPVTGSVYRGSLEGLHRIEQGAGEGRGMVGKGIWVAPGWNQAKHLSPIAAKIRIGVKLGSC